MNDQERDVCKAGYCLTYALSFESLIKSLKYGNRFFLNDYFFDKIKEYAEKAINNVPGPLTKKMISPDKFLYRARIMLEHTERYITDYENYEKKMGEFEKYEDGFYGYQASESFAPPKGVVKDGRLNPQYIQMLYTASHPYTALMEVKPILNSHVSIATIRAKEPLTILQIDSNIKYNNDEDGDDCFLYCINRIFSTPSHGSFEDYLPVQYITEYIESTKKFDGIEFQSSLDTEGSNIVIFDQNKCEAISSKLYLVKEISYKADCLIPYDKTELKPGGK
jgi:hypothetical protein